MKVIAYKRTSSEKNRDSHSFFRQEEAIKFWAKRNGAEVVNSFEEVFTGTEADRPVFSAMINQMAESGIKTFVVENQTRLGRDLMVNLHLIASCKNMGISIIDASTGDDLTNQNDPMSVAMTQICGVFAQLEKSQLVSKLRKARDAKSKSLGKRIEGRKKITLPSELIQKIKKLRRKPANAKRLTYQGIADILNHEGYATGTGKKFLPMTINRVLEEN
jgi:DNA invertase Pin-like site-specific DNA recombinase